MSNWQDVPLDDASLNDPEAIREVFAQFNQHIRRLSEEVKRDRADPQMITVTTDTGVMDLQNAIRRSTLPVGAVIWLYTTWAKALTLREFGWEICHSGNPLTPPIIPGPDTADDQRLIRGVAYGRDAYDQNRQARTDGSLPTHTHDETQYFLAAGDEDVTLPNTTGVTADYPPVVDLIPIMRVR